MFGEIKVYGIEHVSICREMYIGDGEQRVSACKYIDFMCGGFCSDYWNAHKKYVDNIEDLYRMLIFDAIIANEDRHLNNWELSLKDGHAVMVTVFDNGASLFSWCSDENVKIFKKIGRDKSKPFKDTHDKQVALVKKEVGNVKLFGGISIEKAYRNIIDNGAYVFELMTEYRAEAIKRCLWNRMNKYLKPFI